MRFCQLGVKSDIRQHRHLNAVPGGADRDWDSAFKPYVVINKLIHMNVH